MATPTKNKRRSHESHPPFITPRYYYVAFPHPTSKPLASRKQGRRGRGAPARACPPIPTDVRRAGPRPSVARPCSVRCRCTCTHTARLCAAGCRATVPEPYRARRDENAHAATQAKQTDAERQQTFIYLFISFLYYPGAVP